MTARLPEFAFYYPGPVWARPDWIKNLILFFDGVALLVPNYIRDKPSRVDPETTRELEDNGLLKIIEPESFIDKAAVQKLSGALTDIIASGKLDGLARQGTEFHELSYSRLGSMADEQLANEIYTELRKRGLAKESQDGVSIPIHSTVRVLILVLWSQILRPIGASKGLDLQPATDRPEVHSTLKELLNFRELPSAGHVVSLDLETVGVDLAGVPVAKVLKFREKHQDEFRTYARDIRAFVREISVLPPHAQHEAYEDRKEKLAEAARKLRKIAKQAWAKPASFGLGIAGAVWTFTTGDVVSGAFAMGGGLLGAELSGPPNADAYSYIFRAKRKLD